LGGGAAGNGHGEGARKELLVHVLTPELLDDSA
jgi:hypothetical protein